MSLIGYISSRFNRHGTLPPSLKVMRIIAMTGIAVATATLIVTLAILRGFEREYRRTILDFNAHVVLLCAGESGEGGEAEHLIDQCRFSDDDRRFMQRHRIALWGWRWFEGVSRRYASWHARVMYETSGGSVRQWILELMAPTNIARVIPPALPAWGVRLGEFDRKGVIGATPFIYREGLMIAKGTIKGVVVKGVDPLTLGKVNPMRIDLAPGYGSLDEALQGNEGTPSVILGVGLARALGMDELGDPLPAVRILVPTAALRRGENHFRELVVTGIFESGLYDYDAQFALMSLVGVRALYDMPEGRITGLELKLDDPDKAWSVGAWLEQRLGPTWRAVPWGELNAEIFRAVEMEKKTFSIIMGMLMVVAAFNIIGVLVLVIIVRLPEISILRALGMASGELQRVFIRGGLLIGAIGVGCGLAVGVGIALALKSFNIVRLAPEVYFLARLPIDISPSVCGMIALFCLTTCWITSRAAARKLAGVSVIEGLSKAY